MEAITPKFVERKLNFVFVGLQRILTDRESTATSIAKELAKNHNVLYVNSPIDRRAYWFGSSDRFVNEHILRIRQKTKPLEKVENGLWVLYPEKIIESINWIPNTWTFSRLNRINNSRLSKEIGSAVAEIGFDDYIIVNDKDIFRSFYLKELLKPSQYIYLDRDYIVGMDYWKRHGSKLEPDLMRSSDVILCNSYGFRNRALAFNPASYYIGNGCDIGRFDYQKQYQIPGDLLPLVDRPVIGYVGALLEMRLDIPLLVFLAKSRPELNLVLVGSEDEAFRDSELHLLPNVHFLGKKDTELAPAYIQHFDVCINPQHINEITNDNYPLKIDEYLAMGRPVVATETNVMREIFSSVTYLAKDHVGFLEKITEALGGGGRGDAEKARVAMAKSHSWQAVAERVLAIISPANKNNINN
ncbi:glycosyltransferase [Parapedobacter sp. 10938]|uniref:glycosyltransferase n=1 Tax=Parapedobacter flavus TaxID=3110225 RepID=UPI002DBF7386|nr:glycosyltransferase [Parapedobacter sp. 10938]MEC3879892.1 glycosyltransferase [Parapedobacter sp. 10938]